MPIKNKEILLEKRIFFYKKYLVGYRHITNISCGCCGQKTKMNSVKENVEDYLCYYCKTHFLKDKNFIVNFIFHSFVNFDCYLMMEEGENIKDQYNNKYSQKEISEIILNSTRINHKFKDLETLRTRSLRILLKKLPIKNRNYLVKSLNFKPHNKAIFKALALGGVKFDE